MKKPILSIVIPTYNHVNYVSFALDSVLKQNTKYSFEVIVGDDCSNDGTQEILKQYEEMYPNRFQILYRDHNLYNEEIGNIRDLLMRARGKYLIILEGDDYWISENKIEKQITFLENNPDYIAVSHNCIVVDENNNETGEIYPECHNEEYSLKDFLFEVFPGQTATIMYKNYEIDNLFNTCILHERLVPMDRLIYFCLINSGKIHCIQEKMSAYRHIIHGGSSYSANYKYDFEYSHKWHLSLYNYSKSYCNEFGQDVAGALYLTCLVKGFSKGKLSFLKLIKIFLCDIHDKPSVLFWFFRRYFHVHLKF